MHEQRQWLLENPFLWIAPLALGAAAAAVAVSGDWWALALVGVVAVLLMTGFLRVRVAGDLTLLLWPFWKRTLDLAAVERAEVIEYVWWKFGGWGIRWGDGAIAYSVWGKQAVRLNLEGRDLVVQVKDAEGLLEALRAQGVTAVSRS